MTPVQHKKEALAEGVSTRNANAQLLVLLLLVLGLELVDAQWQR